MGISKDSALVSTGKGKESRVQGKAAQAWLGSVLGAQLYDKLFPMPPVFKLTT